MCLGVISVGAVDATGTVAPFSGRAPYLTLTAPGVNIPSLGRVAGRAVLRRRHEPGDRAHLGRDRAGVVEVPEADRRAGRRPACWPPSTGTAAHRAAPTATAGSNVYRAVTAPLPAHVAQPGLRRGRTVPGALGRPALSATLGARADRAAARADARTGTYSVGERLRAMLDADRCCRRWRSRSPGCCCWPCCCCARRSPGDGPAAPLPSPAASAATAGRWPSRLRPRAARLPTAAVPARARRHVVVARQC